MYSVHGLCEDLQCMHSAWSHASVPEHFLDSAYYTFQMNNMMHIYFASGKQMHPHKHQWGREVYFYLNNSNHKCQNIMGQVPKTHEGILKIMRIGKIIMFQVAFLFFFFFFLLWVLRNAWDIFSNFFFQPWRLETCFLKVKLSNTHVHFSVTKSDLNKYIIIYCDLHKKIMIVARGLSYFCRQRNMAHNNQVRDS